MFFSVWVFTLTRWTFLMWFTGCTFMRLFFLTWFIVVRFFWSPVVRFTFTRATTSYALVITFTDRFYFTDGFNTFTGFTFGQCANQILCGFTLRLEYVHKTFRYIRSFYGCNLTLCGTDQTGRSQSARAFRTFIGR